MVCLISVFHLAFYGQQECHLWSLAISELFQVRWTKGILWRLYALSDGVNKLSFVVCSSDFLNTNGVFVSLSNDFVKGLKAFLALDFVTELRV